MWVVSMLLRRHMRYLVFLLSWSMATDEWQCDNNFFFSFFSFFFLSPPQDSSQVGQNWTMLCHFDFVLDLIFIFLIAIYPILNPIFIYFLFHFILWYLVLFSFHVKFDPYFFYLFFSYYFLNWICFSVSSLNI